MVKPALAMEKMGFISESQLEVYVRFELNAVLNYLGLNSYLSFGSLISLSWKAWKEAMSRQILYL